MFNISLTSNIKNPKLLAEATRELKKELIQKGLDKPISSSLLDLKTQLKFYINEEVRSKGANTSGKDSDTPAMNLPKSDEDLLKFLTGIDLTKIRSSQDHTSSVQSNAIVVDNYRARLRFPISDYETFQENHDRAVRFFNQAMFAFVTSSGVQYFINPGIDMRDSVKVVCSRDTGDTPGSRKKFDAYKDSNKMSRQGNSEIGRFAEWSLKQDAVKNILNGSSGFINITNVIKEIKEGNIDEAQSYLSSTKANSVYPGLQEKLQNLKDKKNLTPEVQTYSTIIDLINNLKIEKVISNSTTVYNLISFFSETEDKDSLKFFNEVNNQINVWIFNNSQLWFDQFVKLAESILKKYDK